jgi:anti-sigma factor RsiW
MFTRHPVSDDELSALVDGMLPAARQATVTSHTEACEACRHKLGELRTVKAVLAAMPRAATRRSFALTSEQAATRPAAPAPRSTPRYALAPAIAMSVLVMLLAVDLAVLGGGAGEDTAGGLATGALKADDANTFAEGAPSMPGAAGTTAEAPAVAQSPAAARATGAESDADAPPAGTPVAPATGRQPAPEAADGGAEDRPASPREAAAERDDGDDIALIRILEGIAVLAVVATLAYAVMRSRKRPEFQ